MTQQLSFEFRTPAEENAAINQEVDKVNKKISKLKDQISQLVVQKNTLLSQTRVDCPNCKNPFMISESEYLQTHWYTEPHGCTGGDYWNIGEGNCVCPNCRTRLRLYKCPELYNLKTLFKSIKDVYER